MNLLFIFYLFIFNIFVKKSSFIPDLVTYYTKDTQCNWIECLS